MMTSSTKSVVKNLLFIMVVSLMTALFGCTGWTTDYGLGTSDSSEAPTEDFNLDSVKYKFSMKYENERASDSVSYGVLTFVLGEKRIPADEMHYAWMDKVFASDTVKIRYSGNGNLMLMTYEDDDHRTVEMVRSLEWRHGDYLRDRCETYIDGVLDESEKGCAIYWFFDQKNGEAVLGWN